MENDIDIRLMEPDEVGKLQALIDRCYEGTYYDHTYYDHSIMGDMIENKDQYSMVAVNKAGEFVSHIGLRNHKGSLSADSSAAIVDPRYRSAGLFVDVGTAFFPIYEALNLSGFYLQAVTVHPFTQRAAIKGGSGVIGIYLNYTPSFTKFLDIDANAVNKPTPAVVLWQPLKDAPQRTISIPNRYRQQILNAFQQCNMLRNEVEAPVATINAYSTIRVVKKPRQKIAYIWIDKLGKGLLEELKPIVDDLDTENDNATYVQLPLDAEDLTDTIDSLREIGFFYAGTLVEYGKRDWLTLQRIDRDSLDVTGIHLFNDECQQLMDFILQD